MRFIQLAPIASILLLASALPSSASPRVHRGPTSPRILRERTSAPKPKSAAARGIDAGRATEIQTALISAGYLTGAPSGTWDGQTQAAMEHLQSDNGWQTKLVPDARAINKLGLGANASKPGPQASSAGIGDPSATPTQPALPAENKQ